MSSTDKNSSQFEISYETSAEEAMTATPAKKHASGILNPENDGWGKLANNARRWLFSLRPNLSRRLPAHLLETRRSEASEESGRSHCS
ncbi:hypothetical protein PAAG_03422 [Paracoccidioides lutzii Pb01]|uniref:Uncharacterized protein n=1 Tax=Paracoccidioides lutzii (strain ATCC MYA-826 / Pb01) TaxID=502779 RepID=C1GX48_PARBA|nr:hypothetical protein PAAG_03422 [Paracoccidioides lutzii Pb01]EEH41136.2 hypothetical protein PAAG_03422 [Paracoccidioides lutzii Pb01]